MDQKYPVAYVPERCGNCGGDGSYIDGILRKSCDQCGGTGKRARFFADVYILTQEELDVAIIQFAVWLKGTEGKMYESMHLSAQKLLNTYRDRPYKNDDNTEKQ